MDLAELVRSVGVPAGLLLFFVWQGHLREQRMARRLDRVEDEIRGRLLNVIEENTTTQKALIGTLDRLEQNCAKRMAAHLAEGRA